MRMQAILQAVRFVLMIIISFLSLFFMLWGCVAVIPMSSRSENSHICLGWLILLTSSNLYLCLAKRFLFDQRIPRLVFEVLFLILCLVLMFECVSVFLMTNAVTDWALAFAGCLYSFILVYLQRANRKRRSEFGIISHKDTGSASS